MPLAIKEELEYHLHSAFRISYCPFFPLVLWNENQKHEESVKELSGEGSKASGKEITMKENMLPLTTQLFVNSYIVWHRETKF